MWLLPYDRISLDSHRSPDELLAALQRLTRPPDPIGKITFIIPKETATFVGEVTKERIEFRRAFRGRNSFAPFVIGRIVTGPSGARIEAVMRPHTIVLGFVAFWLALVLPWAIRGAQQLMNQGAAAGPEAWIPILMCGALYPMCMLGFVPEALKMRRILGEIITPGSAPPP